MDQVPPTPKATVADDGRETAGGVSMAWWVYKCNSRENPYGAGGDWREFFDRRAAGGKAARWGLTTVIPDLSELNPQDMVFAYQTNRNELVGLVRVVRRDGEEVHFEAVEEFGVRVRPLKSAYPAVALIPAFAPGPKKTIYPISESDAQVLLDAARASE
jgi:hypothetical protein